MIEIPIDPVPKPRMTKSDKWKQRTAVLRYFSYADALRAALPRFVVPSELVIRFFIVMPKSWSAKKRASMLEKPHTQRPDIDNLAKAFMDALAEDDSYIYSLHAEKYWSDKGAVHVLTPEENLVIYSKGISTFKEN